MLTEQEELLCKDSKELQHWLNINSVSHLELLCSFNAVFPAKKTLFLIPQETPFFGSELSVWFSSVIQGTSQTATISKQWCDSLIYSSRIHFLFYPWMVEIVYSEAYLRWVQGFTYPPRALSWFQAQPIRIIKNRSGAPAGLCPQCLCGWNSRNCMLKCRGLNVTGARSAHYGWAGV